MNRSFKFIIFITLVIFMNACTNKTPYTQRSQMIFISSSEELALGEKSYKKTLSTLKIIKNTKQSEKIKEIGLRIAKVSNKKDFKWEFTLVEDKKMNAFCLPGGKVVIYTGILRAAKNDSQLATVMSHEIAHALARHGAERMSSSMLQQGLQNLGNVLLSAAAPEYTNVFNQAYGIGTNLGIMLPYGRLQESEADEIGIILMNKAGYDVNEALKFWKNMSSGKKEKNEFFSTHPSSSTRIKNIQNIINKLNIN